MIVFLSKPATDQQVVFNKAKVAINLTILDSDKFNVSKIITFLFRIKSPKTPRITLFFSFELILLWKFRFESGPVGPRSSEPGCRSPYSRTPPRTLAPVLLMLTHTLTVMLLPSIPRNSTSSFLLELSTETRASRTKIR